MHPKHLSVSDFDYPLPDDRIAAFPLAQRDASKLLVYRDGVIQESIYQQLPSFLPANSTLVFNNTRVIPARVVLQKSTGGLIEVFCLEPLMAQTDYNLVLQQTGSSRWKCLVGGAAKWKSGALQANKRSAQGDELMLQATLVERTGEAFILDFSWTPTWLTLAEVFDAFGDTPLPPYIRRKAEPVDKERYQTIYARFEGSVAAPTAGLHFTPQVFDGLKKQSIEPLYVTLHVGAGTFKPVKSDRMEGHDMHAEWMDVSLEAIRALAQASAGFVTAVGTTSLRTIESLYWMGVKCMQQRELQFDRWMIHQWDVYEKPLVDVAISAEEALSALAQRLEEEGQDRLMIPTQILLAPGYRYRVAQALVTNFHQPQSTLILLVAAAVGDAWRAIYSHALENDYRFLSYGDGSLLYFGKEQVGRV